MLSRLAARLRMHAYLNTFDGANDLFMSMPSAKAGNKVLRGKLREGLSFMPSDVAGLLPRWAVPTGCLIWLTV